MEIPDNLALQVASKMREVMELFRCNNMLPKGLPAYCDFCVLCDAETKSIEFGEDRTIIHKDYCVGKIFTEIVDPTGELAPPGKWTR